MGGLLYRTCEECEERFMFWQCSKCTGDNACSDCDLDCPNCKSIEERFHNTKVKLKIVSKK